MVIARADVVGSLLRPPALREAREALTRGEISQARFEEIENEAVDQAVSLQEEAGLDVVTDGEMRRLSFQSQMTEAVEGFGDWDLDAFLWGDWRGDERVGERSIARPPELGVVSKLRRKRFLSVEEFTYLKSRTRRIAKVTLPSPSLWANFWSRELASGGYEAIASAIFGNLAAHRLLLEYDDERSGGFEPLSSVPDDKTVVLGLVTTKSPRRETPEELSARVREAAKHVPLERLALSPQCGFSTSVLGNRLPIADEKRKLEIIAETARRVWK